jgi:hypothetical protein
MLALLGALLGRLPAALGELQPLDSDLEAIALQGTTAYGRSLLLLSSVTALQTAIGLGALAYFNSVPQGGLDDNAVLGNNIANGTIGSAKLAPGAVTLDKIQAIANQRLLGNNSGAAGVPAEISFSAVGLSLLQAADAAAARSAIAAVDNTHQNQTVGPSLHGLGSNVRVLGNRNASGEFIQRGSADASPAAVALSPTSLQYSDIPVTFAAAYASAPLVFCAATAGAFANAVSPTTTGFTMRIFHTTPGSPFVSGNFIAIGA